MGQFEKDSNQMLFINSRTKPKVLQQFLIRRKRSLELMYTNGLCHWVTEIKGSKVESPYIISDISLSQDNRILIVFCQVKNMES